MKLHDVNDDGSALQDFGGGFRVLCRKVYIKILQIVKIS